MAIRMIVLDLDDTLLQDDLTISEATHSALMRAQKQGVKVVLASGRPTYAIEAYATQLELAEHGGFIIGFNGAMIKSCALDETLFRQTISRDTVLELHQLSKTHGVFIHTYVGNDIVTPENNPWTVIEEQLTGMKIRETEDFAAAVPGDVVKVLMLEEPERLKVVEGIMKAAMGDRLSINISKPFFLEFMDQGIDKSFSLNLLAGQLGISQAEIMAVGDSYNDITMIQYAGLGVAMANAPEAVKKVADCLTASNMEDGVAKAVEQYVLKDLQTAR